MILTDAIIFLIILALLLRRDFSGLARLNVWGGWKLALFIVGLFVLQAALIIYVSQQNQWQALLLIVSQLVLAGLLLINHHVPGVKLFALGIMLNTVVMVANGGWMPMTPETYHFVHPDKTATVSAKPAGSKNIILPRDETNLWILSDAIPVKLPWRRSVVSAGDLFLILGAAQFIFVVGHRRKDMGGKTKPIHSKLKEVVK